MKAKPFILGVACTVVLFTAMSFAIFRPNGLLAARPTATPIAAWQLTLDRVFHAPVTVGSTPMTVTMPSTGGCVITSLHWNSGNIPAHSEQFTISVNGVAEQFGPNFAEVGGNNEIIRLEPPIIAKPGDVVSITTNAPGATVVISGYVVVPGEV